MKILVSAPAILAAIGGLFVYSLWLITLARRSPHSSARYTSVSFAALILIVMLQVTVLDPRSNDALLTEGLSRRNLVQIVLTGFISLWAGYLMLSHHVRASSLVSGGLFWCTLALLIDGASAWWSIWPQLTLFRTVELAAGYILSVHLFANIKWHSRLKSWLTGAVFIYLLQPFVALGAGVTSRITFADFHSNSGGGAAALLLIILFQARQSSTQKTGRPLVAMFLCLTAIVLMGSLGSWAALACGLVCLVSRAIRFWAITTGLLIALAIGLGATAKLNSGADAIRAVGGYLIDLTGRDARLIDSWTGRLPLWEDILSQTEDEPLGTGYAASERTFAIYRARVADNWRAMSAHNGFLSAWLGTGWLGVATIVCLFVAAFRRARHSPAPLNALLTATVLTIGIENLTVPGVGSTFGIDWVAMFAVCSCATPATEGKAWTGDRARPAIMQFVPSDAEEIHSST